jgi:hypothetical protein
MRAFMASVNQELEVISTSFVTRIAADEITSTETDLIRFSLSSKMI